MKIPPQEPFFKSEDSVRCQSAAHSVYLRGSSVVCKAGAGETILLACARAGVILSAPCGGRRRCGKCKVQLLEGRVSGDTPDAEGWVRACMAVPMSDIVIACSVNTEIVGNEVAAPAAGGPRSAPARAGVALDIGTTTVSAKLINLDTSLAIDTVSELNDQRVFGADVMSRIGAARNGKTGELFNLINRQTERILKSFEERWGITKIEKLCVSGNTVMLHLFLNTDPSSMGEVPFTPVFLDEKELSGGELSLSVEKVTLLPSIAAFVGGDITAGLAVLDITNTPGPSLLIDIGTNGEMALCNKGTIFCCSTAAGPAFEGAEISCGVGGVKGAISGVGLAAGTADTGTSAVSITTIGNAPPIGVCGSGLIDAVAVMLKLGILDETGSITAPEGAFKLAGSISISGKDIRQFQLAKSAIFSGVKILCKNAGLALGEIKNVYIAGGFGFFINKQNAVYSGILPGDFLEAISVAGNLSLEGASQCLTAENFIAKCKDITAKCSIVDLASDPSFMEEFAENMLFAADE